MYLKFTCLLQAFLMCLCFISSCIILTFLLIESHRNITINSLMKISLPFPHMVSNNIYSLSDEQMEVRFTLNFIFYSTLKIFFFIFTKKVGEIMEFRRKQLDQGCQGNPNSTFSENHVFRLR